MEGWNATSGDRLWTKQAEGEGFRGHPENLWDKVILWRDQVLDQRGPGLAYNILTGDPILRRNPLTGKVVPWQFTKIGHHCNYAIAGEHLMTFRAESAGFLDIATGGTTHLRGFRSGCRNSLIPANGILNAPNFAQGCRCNYSIFTSLALVHTPEVEKWSYSPLKLGEGELKRVGINFGAPGDRLVSDGSLWLNYPATGGPSPDLKVVHQPENPSWFRNHTSQISGDGLKWVASSGVEGLSTVTIPLGKTDDQQQAFTVRLYFAETEKSRIGERVFDVELDGKTVLQELDIFKEAGGKNRLLVKEIKGVRLLDSLRLELTARKGKTLISGVELVRDGG